MTKFQHQPVMVKEVLEYLSPKDGGIYVDGTLGGGGHARALLEELSANSCQLSAKIIGIDCDLEAIFAAKKNLGEFENQIIFIHDNFSNLPAILKSQGIEKVNFILLDLGVSSHQLDNPQRGFSFQTDAPLDMRMNQCNDLTAGKIINFYDEKNWRIYFINMVKNDIVAKLLEKLLKAGDSPLLARFERLAN